MAWHIETLVAHARRYTVGKNYANRDRFASIVTIQVLNGTKAYLSGMLNDGSEGVIHPDDWRDLRDGIREKYGIEVIETERRSRPRSYQTASAPLAPDIELP